MLKSHSRRIYLRLTDAERDDPESSDPNPVEQAAPQNFLLLLTARAASKVGDRLASPKTTLAWLLQSLGAPSLFIRLIAPLREDTGYRRFATLRAARLRPRRPLRRLDRPRSANGSPLQQLAPIRYCQPKLGS